jgi:FkbM family methyltransferase
MLEAMAESLAADLAVLPPKARMALLFRQLHEAGVKSVVADGDNGEIEGYTADLKVMAKYAKNRTWSAEIVGRARATLDLAQGGSYIDLGANIGLTTVPVASARGVLSWAVEPHPDNLRLLELNLARNRLSARTTVVHAAISDEPGTLSLEVAEENLGDHRIHPAAPVGEPRYGEEERTVIDVPAQCLDDIVDVSLLSDPVVIKMDIQGAEPLAFAGGPGVLDRAALVLTEYWPYGLKRLGADLDQYHSLIATTFSHGALLGEGDLPGTVDLMPIDDLIGRLADVTAERDIEAADLALTKRSGKI